MEKKRSQVSRKERRRLQYSSTKKEMWKRQRKGWKKKEEVGSIGRDSLKGRIDENEVVDTLLFCVWRTDWNM